MYGTELTFWLLLISVGLIALFIGYRIGRRSSGTGAMTTVGELQQDIARLNRQLNECRQEKALRYQRTAGGFPDFDPEVAEVAMGRKVYQDDLKLIEGIGPKIEGLFHNFDIKTWRELAAADVAKCQEVLDSGGDRYRVHDPSSWPLQARMACEGDWQSLARWQEEHKHGRL